MITPLFVMDTTVVLLNNSKPLKLYALNNKQPQNNKRAMKTSLSFLLQFDFHWIIFGREIYFQGHFLDSYLKSRVASKEKVNFLIAALFVAELPRKLKQACTDAKRVEERPPAQILHNHESHVGGFAPKAWWHVKAVQVDSPSWRQGRKDSSHSFSF